MILTCPNCATRFFADDQAIGAGGRRVKCDACGKVWTGSVSSPAEAMSEEARADAKLPLETSHDAEAKAETIAPLFVERAAANRGAKRKNAGKSWALGLVVMLFLVIVGGLVFQPAIERTFPASVSFYQSLGVKSADPRS